MVSSSHHCRPASGTTLLNVLGFWAEFLCQFLCRSVIWAFRRQARERPNRFELEISDSQFSTRWHHSFFERQHTTILCHWEIIVRHEQRHLYFETKEIMGRLVLAYVKERKWISNNQYGWNHQNSRIHQWRGTLLYLKPMKSLFLIFFRPDALFHSF